MRWLWVLCALPFLGQAAEINLTGTQVSAKATRNLGFAVLGGDPTGGAFAEETGDIQITGLKRVEDPRLTYGDEGSLQARIDLPAGRFRIEMNQVGAPPGTPRWVP